jgi:hypothetical protein
MSKSRRTLAIVFAALAIGALVAATALAATTTWRGNGTRDTRITVSFKKVSGQPSKVKNMNIGRLHFDCQNTDDFRSGIAFPTMQVHAGQFSRNATYTNADGSIRYTTRLSGKFLSPRTATGTIKQRRTVVADPSTTCTTVEEPWRAHKQ